MHPEIIRQLIEQNNRETRARAQENRIARDLMRALRLQRRNAAVDHHGYHIPAIPDYVDGSFAESAKSPAGRVPAAHDAA
jgi:hypothetical protein